jgi:hypothetical protein
MIFNGPRIAVLTLFGAVFGAVAYAAVQGIAGWSLEWTGVVRVAAAAYFGAGALLTLYGMYTFAGALDERADMLDGIHPDAGGDPPCGAEGCSGASGPFAALSNRLPDWLSRRAPKTRGEGFLATWGLLLGVACLGETAVALEAALVGAAVGGLAEGMAAAVLLGAGAMFMFGLGASLPLIAASGMCAAAVDGKKRRMSLLNIRIGGAAAMMVVGTLLCMLFWPALIVA